MKFLTSITLLFLLTACGNPENKKETEAPVVEENTVTLTESQLKTAGITLRKLEKKNIPTIIKVNGKIDVPPQNMVSISMPLGGYLKFTKLLPGMHVNKGEVIAILEDQQYIQLQQDYLITKAKLANAEAEYERQKSLNESKASSDKVLQQAKAEYQSFKISVNALGEKLKLININPESLTENNLSKNVNIYSPIEGFVSSVNVNVGKYVTPTDVLFELVNPNDIHLNLYVFEKDLPLLSIGQELISYANNEPDKKYKCEIILISRSINPDGTIEVHCHFENYDKSLAPGMYMNAEIEVKNTNAYFIADDAIVNFDGKNYLFVSTGKNQFKMTPAETGISSKGFTEIKNIQQFDGKQIVEKGAYNLLMSLKNKSE